MLTNPPRGSRGLIRDQVYEELKKQILTLQLKPGQFISEKEAIDMLGVSRTPIREAFVRLAQEELIETIPQKGSFVSLIKLGYVEEARFVREQLESAVVRLACDRLDNEQIFHLENIIAHQKLCIQEKNYPKIFELDEQFHQMIFDGCGMSRTSELLRQFGTHLYRIRQLRLTLDWQIIVSQHQNIVDAIKKRNPDEAEQAMRTHMRLVVYEKDELIKQYPNYFKQ